MDNLADVVGCNDIISRELEIADIPYHFVGRSSSEVPFSYVGILDGWTFTRAWRYWVARAEETVLFFGLADELHVSHGNEVRVSGHGLAPAPREWYDQPWSIGVSLYHVDTQEGLNALADAIRKQTREIGGTK